MIDDDDELNGGKRKLPVLLADPKGDHWDAWCPFCRRFHSHSPEPGYRVAHCHQVGVFDDGYILIERSRASLVEPRYWESER